MITDPVNLKEGANEKGGDVEKDEKRRMRGVGNEEDFFFKRNKDFYQRSKKKRTTTLTMRMSTGLVKPSARGAEVKQEEASRAGSLLIMRKSLETDVRESQRNQNLRLGQRLSLYSDHQSQGSSTVQEGARSVGGMNVEQLLKETTHLLRSIPIPHVQRIITAVKSLDASLDKQRGKLVQGRGPTHANSYIQSEYLNTPDLEKISEILRLNYWSKVLYQQAISHQQRTIPMNQASTPQPTPALCQNYSPAQQKVQKICIEEVKLGPGNYIDAETLQKFESNDKGVVEAIQEVINQNLKDNSVAASTLKAVKKLIENRICLRLAIQNACSRDDIVIERSPKQIELDNVSNSRASKYRGVSLNGSKWQIFIVINTRGKKRYLGRFPSQELAARYYDRASIQFNGIKARTNFSYSAAEAQEILNRPGVVRETLKFRRFRDQVSNSRKRDCPKEDQDSIHNVLHSGSTPQASNDPDKQ